MRLLLLLAIACAQSAGRLCGWEELNGGAWSIECTDVDLSCPSGGANSSAEGANETADAPSSSDLCRLLNTTALNDALEAASPALATLELRGQQLGERGALVLAASLARREHLKVLGLSSCRLSDRGLTALLNGWGARASLTRLDLSHNWLTDDSARALSPQLKSMLPALTHLELSWNGFGPRGAKAFAEALSGSSLVELGLAWNGLKDRGARALAEALTANEKLEILNLEHNAITDGGARDLAKALLQNGKLAKLEVGANGITEPMTAKLDEALRAVPAPKPAPKREQTPKARGGQDEDTARQQVEADEDVEEISFDEDRDEL